MDGCSSDMALAIWEMREYFIAAWSAKWTMAHMTVSFV